MDQSSLLGASFWVDAEYGYLDIRFRLSVIPPGYLREVLAFTADIGVIHGFMVWLN